jgi:hypothetical protein
MMPIRQANQSKLTRTRMCVPGENTFPNVASGPTPPGRRPRSPSRPGRRVASEGPQRLLRARTNRCSDPHDQIAPICARHPDVGTPDHRDAGTTLRGVAGASLGEATAAHEPAQRRGSCTHCWAMTPEDERRSGSRVNHKADSTSTGPRRAHSGDAGGPGSARPDRGGSRDRR